MNPGPFADCEDAVPVTVLLSHEDYARVELLLEQNPALNESDLVDAIFVHGLNHALSADHPLEIQA